MRIQVTLIPPESKKLISHAVVSLDVVEKARQDGIILVGASTTCAFLLEELIDKKITEGYGCGITIPRGTCIMQEMLDSIRQRGYARIWVLEKGELCATVEIKITYFKPVRAGNLICDTRVIHKGKTIGILESEIKNNGTLVSKAYGTFSIFKYR